MTTLRALHEMVDRDSEVGDMARALCFGRPPPLAFAMDPDLYIWVREIADSAPARVKFGMLGQLKLPAPLVFVELPSLEGGMGIYAKVEGDVVVASRVNCDDEDVWAGPLIATFKLPADQPAFDWAQADAPSWQADRASDAPWIEWANKHIGARLRPGAEPPDRPTTDSIFKNTLVPDLLVLAAISAPSAGQFAALAWPGGAVLELGRIKPYPHG